MADLRKLGGKGPRDWADLVRAVFELALANRRLRRVHPRRLGLLGEGYDAAEGGLTAAEARLVDRVSWAVVVMGLRVPWRSDCLVQALAARRWLGRGGVATRIGIGVRRTEEGALMAHAWLKAGDRLVTGGDISPYGEFLRAEGRPAEP